MGKNELISAGGSSPFLVTAMRLVGIGISRSDEYPGILAE
jgi:hypothetical protein